MFSGRVVGAASIRYFGNFFSLCGRMLSCAAREGASMASWSDFQKWVLELNAINVNVIRAIRSSVSRALYLNENIREVILRNDSGNVCYVSCQGNMVAHYLASFDVSPSVEFCWLDSVLSFIALFVIADLMPRGIKVLTSTKKKKKSQ